MSDLYGAPSGVIAWDQNARANALAGAQVTESQLNAQLKLGQLAQAPADAALLAARTREQNALADQHEVATSISRQQLGFEDAYKAFQKLSTTAAAQGQMATWQDLPGVDSPRATNPDGTQKSMTQEILSPNYSITKPLEDKLAFMQKIGAPTVVTMPLIKEIVDAKEKTAIGDYRSAQAKEQDQKVQMQKLKQIGGEAAAAAQDDQAYAQFIMKSKGSPDPQVRQLASRLSGTGREADASALLGFAKSTLDYETQVKNKQADAKLKLENDQVEVAKGKARVAAGLAASREKLYAARVDALGKDGEGTVNQVAVAEQKAYATYMRLQKDREAASPPAPLDPSFYTKRPNSTATYTLKDGSIARPVIQDGKIMWDVLKPPLKKVPPPRSLEDIAAGRKARKAATMQDSTDELATEED